MSPSELHDHLAKIGARGGSAGTEEQKRARTLNMYRALALKHPNSVKVMQKLKELERE